MKQRTIGRQISRLAHQYPVITVTGPRQSGKTTLCKMIFKDKEYVTLEDPDTRFFAEKDPRGFLERYQNGAILDEIQRSPGLLSFIQTLVDKKQKSGMFILTGSQQFELMNNLSQSLAGRTALVKLLPFSLKEAYQNKIPSMEKVIYTGFYPRIFDKKLNPTEAMGFYINTYVERDLRLLVNVKDLTRFQIFLRLCAGRIGQILNLSSLGNDCGVNHSTIKNWISVLESSYIIKLIYPYYKNFSKRLIKSPKIYFYDTGLASYLLNITSETQLLTHYLKGPLFENLVIIELLKDRFNAIMPDNIYFFRDNIGNEIDLISESGNSITAIEIKSGKTVAEDFFKGLDYFKKLAPDITQNLIYGGSSSFSMNGIDVSGWKDLANRY
jgi:uncharacterized protein